MYKNDAVDEFKDNEDTKSTYTQQSATKVNIFGSKKPIKEKRRFLNSHLVVENSDTMSF